MKKIPLGKILLVAAALFQATQYTRLGRLLDANSSQWFWLVAGATVNLSLAYAANRLPRIRSKSAQAYSRAAFWCMVVITPALLAPVNLVTLSHAITGFTRWLVAILAASVVDLAIVFVAFADGNLLPQEQVVKEAVREIPPQQVENRKRKAQARKHVTDAQLLTYLQENPGSNNVQIARKFGVTRQAISERRKHLTTELTTELTTTLFAKFTNTEIANAEIDTKPQ